jgi:hypothetical protein
VLLGASVVTGAVVGPRVVLGALVVFLVNGRSRTPEMAVSECLGSEQPYLKKQYGSGAPLTFQMSKVKTSQSGISAQRWQHVSKDSAGSPSRSSPQQFEKVVLAVT